MKTTIYILTLLLLPLALALYSLAAERVYTFDDDKAWEVITGKWEIKKGEYYSTGSTEVKKTYANLCRRSFCTHQVVKLDGRLPHIAI